MNNLFIFGAGASKQAGGPLMADFLDTAYDLLRMKHGGGMKAQKEFNLVFDAIADLQGIHSKAYLDLDNLEIVFGAIEMGLLLRKLGERSVEEIQELRNAFVTLIYKTLELSIPFKVVDGRIFPPEPYNAFARMLGHTRKKLSHPDPVKFSFITFNYDLCLEYALHFHGIPHEYCLNGTRDHGRSPLLKLHGSINWGTTDSDDIVPFHVHEANFRFPEKEVYFDLGSNLSFKEHEGKPVQGPPVIVPPTWNKNSYHGQLSNVWAIAAEEIASAENIFVIGYSLPETDSFFRYLFALGAESKKKLRNFVVINPDKTGTTETRFRGLIGRGIENRFSYLPLPFNDALPNIEQTILSP